MLSFLLIEEATLNNAEDVTPINNEGDEEDTPDNIEGNNEDEEELSPIEIEEELSPIELDEDESDISIEIYSQGDYLDDSIFTLFISRTFIEMLFLS